MSKSTHLSNYPHIDNIVDPHGMYQLLQAFLESLAILNYSARTISTREKALLMFIEWSGQRRLIRPTEITRAMLERYQRSLFLHRKQNGEPLSFNTQHSRLVSIRMWFKWLTRQNYLAYNPASELILPRLTKKLPKAVLTTGEVENTLNEADIDTVTGLRDRAILETLYSTGLRRQELVGVRVEDIDRERGTLFVRKGKGGKERIIPIGDRAVQWIDKYMDQAREALSCGRDDGALFLNRFGVAFVPDAISTLVRQYLNKGGVTKPGSSHLFRHTMATLMLENGADIRFIQAMLGHAKLESTEIYTRVSIVKLKNVHTLTHPAKAKPSAESDSNAPTEETLFQALAAEGDGDV